ncbi:MAG: S24/S26 family peptidase [Ruminococcus sp.]|nr:S24/S26 family peptidase [Ruminococcus sp.]
MKTIDTKAFLDTLCELAEKGETVCTVVSGGSMLPFLSGGRDHVFLQKPVSRLKKGDIVLFTRKNGDYVLHRIKSADSKGYYLLGDRQTTPEGPVDESRIRCVAVKVRRKGKILSPNSFCWKFFSIVWIRTVFLRPAIFAMIGIFHKNNRKPKS